MADENKPQERKNVCYRRGITPPTDDKPAAVANTTVSAISIYLDLIKQSLPMIIAVILVCVFAMKLKACMTPEKHVEITYTHTAINMRELTGYLDEAKKQKKPVMIEFYADWCGYCKKLEKEYLSLDVIQNGLKAFVTIQMDVSFQTADQVEIMSKYDVSGTPTLIFIDKNGETAAQLRFTGNIRQDLLNEIAKLR